MKKMIALMMALLISASVSLFSSCAEKSCEHSFGEWETMKEASCVAGEKQRVCENCDFTETEEIPALDDFFAHTFDENTLCTTCGHQEFIESAEYIEDNIDDPNTYLDESYTTIWWNADKSYGLIMAPCGNCDQYGIYDQYTIYDYIGTPINVIIPAKYNNKPITAIETSFLFTGTGFSGCATLKRIIMIDNISKIGRSAFEDCTSLSEIVISSNVSIHENAFKNCISLAKIYLHKNYTKNVEDFYIINPDMEIIRYE